MPQKPIKQPISLEDYEKLKKRLVELQKYIKTLKEEIDPSPFIVNNTRGEEDILWVRDQYGNNLCLNTCSIPFQKEASNPISLPERLKERKCR